MSHTQGNDYSRCKQVSRLGLILSVHLPASRQWLPARIRPLHGYWDSPEFSSDSHESFPSGTIRASLRRYTGYSSVVPIITGHPLSVNSIFRAQKLNPFAPPFLILSPFLRQIQCFFADMD